MSTPHKHAAVIHAFADGAEIEFRKTPEDDWKTAHEPAWRTDIEYRVKPAAPEFAASTISDAALRGTCTATSIINGLPYMIDLRQARACADAAVRHACETQAVVPMADVQEVARNLAKQAEAGEKRYTTTELTLEHYRKVVREETAARELAIAQAVSAATYNATRQNDPYRLAFCDLVLDLPAIIDAVKP